MIEFQLEEAGSFKLRECQWPDFSPWWDTVSISAADANQNLVAVCAIEPTAAALVDLYEDFGFLAGELADRVLSGVGFGAAYPAIRLKDARAAHSRAVALEGQLASIRLPEGGYATGGARDPNKIQAEIEALQLIPLEALDAAERVSRRALFFRTSHGLLAFRPPNASAAANFTDGVTAAKARREGSSFAETCRSLVLACAISPDATTLSTLIHSNPGLVYGLYDVLREAGTGGKAIARP